MRLTQISQSLAETNPHTKFLFHTVGMFDLFPSRILILCRKIARCARGCPQAHSPVNASHDANFWDFRRSSWFDRLFTSRVCQEDHWVPELIRSKHLAFWYFTHFPLYLKPAYGTSHSAINIMATFVHNEPTSLTIIQEIGLPEVFYKVVESGVEPSFEVIQAIPNALGALCLNQTGQDQLAARPSIIPGLLSIFTSERHLRVLQDKENAVLIGTSIDELIRHHPFLKTAVFEGVRSILGQIEDLGKAFVVPEDIRHFYQLIPNPEASLPVQDEAGVAMDIDQSIPVTSLEDPNAQSEELEKEGASQKNPESHDNQIVAFIDVIGRVPFSFVASRTVFSPTSVFGRVVPAPRTLQGFCRKHGWSRTHRSPDWAALSTTRLCEQHRIRLSRASHSHHG